MQVPAYLSGTLQQLCHISRVQDFGLQTLHSRNIFCQHCSAGLTSTENHTLQVVLKLIQPYTRIRIPFVSQQLNIPEHDVEQLLVSLILDNRITGHIDQVQQAYLLNA